MINFKGRTEKGLEVIAVSDHFYAHLGEIEFTYRQIEPKEDLEYYFECVMNQYFMHLGINHRDYGSGESTLLSKYLRRIECRVVPST